MMIQNSAGKLSEVKYSRSDRYYLCNASAAHNFACRCWNRHMRHSWRRLLASFDLDLDLED